MAEALINDQERYYADTLRQAKSGSLKGGAPEATSGSLRQRVAQARRASNYNDTAERIGLNLINKAKTEVKGWFIDTLLPSWGLFRWFRARVRGETMGASSITKLMVLLYENLMLFIIVLGVLAMLAMIVSWATNPWKLLTSIFELGWTAIKSLVTLFSRIFLQ